MCIRDSVYSVFYALATVVIGMSVFVLLPHLDNPQNAFVVLSLIHI